MSKFHFKIAGILAFALLLAIVVVGAAPAFADDGSASTDLAEGLPIVGQKIKWTDFTGAPTIPANTIGLWVWSEDVSGQEVLHLRSGSDGTPKTFSGTIRTNKVGNFYDLALVNGTGDDTATQTKYNEFTFSLATIGGGEGVDVNWSGTWLYLDLYVNGAYVPSKIFVGAAGKATVGAPLGTKAGVEGLLTLPLTTLDGPTAFTKNIADGYYLYRTDGNKYHLRVTTTSRNDLVDYRGHILLEQGLYRAVKEYKRDPLDFVRVVLGKDITFRFVTKGYVDGMDWLVNGVNKPDNMIFTLKLNGDMAAPNISLGSNPFGMVKAYTFRLVE